VAKTAYFDPFSGLSGDMIVGALIDLGVDFEQLKAAIAGMPLSGYRLSVNRSSLSGIAAVKFEVEVTEPQPERHFGEIRELIERSGLSDTATRRAIRIFEVLAEAEAKVHRTTVERVHFHEVGAVDSIIDIVATSLAMDSLDIGEIIVGPMPMGAGMTRSRHGIIPVPAPATVELLAGFTVRFGDGAAEMVTPTGAAIVKAAARPAATTTIFEIERVGYGAGSRRLEDRPNVLRIFLGRERATYGEDRLVKIETNIDDLNPQIYDHLVARLFEAGARDVTLTPTIMKKGRPGVTLSILAPEPLKDTLATIVFEETSTIGLRFHPVDRIKLPRQILQVETAYGPIPVKISGPLNAAPVTITPEYDDCRRAAEKYHVPLRMVIEAARSIAQAKLAAQNPPSSEAAPNRQA
jgi:uncharacterized protein (TIGR00299 family) protein